MSLNLNAACTEQAAISHFPAGIFDTTACSKFGRIRNASPMSEETDFDDEDEDEEDDNDKLNDEYHLPPDSTCTHHPDEPAVTVLDGEPLCEECREQYIDGFRGRDD
jgi:hypothetical protein